VVETVDLKTFSRVQCNEYLLERGFFKKETETSQVPEEFQQGPYLPSKEEAKSEL